MLIHSTSIHWVPLLCQVHCTGGNNKSTVDIIDPMAPDSLLMPQIPHHWGVFGLHGLILSTFLLTECLYCPQHWASLFLCLMSFLAQNWRGRCVSSLWVTCFFYRIFAIFICSWASLTSPNYISFFNDFFSQKAIDVLPNIPLVYLNLSVGAENSQNVCIPEFSISKLEFAPFFPSWRLPPVPGVCLVVHHHSMAELMPPESISTMENGS